LLRLYSYWGSFILAESKDTHRKPGVDFVGIILSAVGLLTLVYGFIEVVDIWMVARKASLYYRFIYSALLEQYVGRAE
jgi:hypothetical protein